MDNILTNPNVKTLRDKAVTDIKKYKKHRKKYHKKNIICIIS